MADHIFVSYDHDDEEFVLALARQLKERGVPVWVDQWDIRAGANWPQAIEKAVIECAQFLIVLSPASIGSAEVGAELRAALDEGKTILPVLHQACRVPFRLRTVQYVDYTGCDVEDSNALEQVLRGLGIGTAGAAQEAASSRSAQPAPGKQQDAEADRQERLSRLYDQAVEARFTRQWDRAVELFGQVVALSQGGYRRAAERLQEAQRQLGLTRSYALGIQAYDQADWDAAVRHLQEVLEIDPRYRDAAARLQEATRQRKLAGLYEDAQRLHRAQSWQATVNAWAEIHAVDAEYADPEGMLESAQAALEAEQRAHELEDLYHRALAQLDAQKWAEASSFLEQIIELEPGYRETEALLKQVRGELFHPSLKVTLSAAQETAQVGETFTWEGAVRNNGDVELLDVTILRGAKKLKTSPALGPGQRRTFKYLVTYESEGETTESVTVRGATRDGQIMRDEAKAKVRIEPRPAVRAVPAPALLPEAELLLTLKGHKKAVRSVAFSPDGATLASGADDRTVRLWRVSDGTLLSTLQAGGKRELLLLNFGAFSVAFSPDGRWLAAGSADGQVRVWQSGEEQLIKALSAHSGWVNGVAFSPDSMLLASGSNDMTVRLWRVPDWELRHELRGHSGTVYNVAFSPNGTLLASASDDKTVQLWRVSDGELVRTLEGHSGWVQSVAFSPDGAVLVSGSNDKTLRLWRVSDGELLRTLEGHSGWVKSVAFSPDGTVVVSGSDDGTVRLWRVEDGELLQSLTGHANSMVSVAFSPDGTMLASGSWDETVRVWRIR